MNLGPLPGAVLTLPWAAWGPATAHQEAHKDRTQVKLTSTISEATVGFPSWEGADPGGSHAPSPGLLALQQWQHVTTSGLLCCASFLGAAMLTQSLLCLCLS